MKILTKIAVLGCLTLAGINSASAQANYWNIGGTYFNCTSGTVTSTAPTTPPTDVYADAFTVPGICSTYYRVGWAFVNGPPHYNALVISDISPDPTGHPFNGSGDQYYLINDGYMHAGASVAVAPLAANGTRKIYATYDNIIKSWTVNSDGTISGATTLYTYPSGTPFDSRTATEVSSDSKYLLINALGSPAGAVIVFDLTTNTPANYPTPGGFVTGFEYVTGWSASARIYVSYNNMWFNPGGTGGFGYYDLGNASTFHNVTTPPSGTDIRGFGFTDIEKAKNGLLYLVYNPTLSTSISNNGTLYAYNSAGSFSAVSGISVPATNNNWSYSVQTQIDGENYSNGYYPQPYVTSIGINGIHGGTTAATAPTILRCPGSGVTLNAGYAGGPLTSKFFAITLGQISGGIFTPNPPPVSYPYASYTSNDTFNVPMSFVSPYVGTYTGAYMIEAFATGPCGNQVSTINFFNVQDISVLANYTKPGCISLVGCSRPIQKTLPITTTPPLANSVIGTFRSNVDSAQGYMGAGSCGMYGINTNGHWTVNVYQVNDTGVRLIIGPDTAPNVVHFTGSGFASGVTYFNQNSYGFDGTHPPFYIDTTTAYGDGPYFSAFYSTARTAGTLTTDLAPRIFCVEMVVNDTVTGCTVTNKSYFKIAINGTYANGYNARPGIDDDADDDFSVHIYPNPVNSTLTIVIPSGTQKTLLQIMDNTGRVLQENSSLQTGKNLIDMGQLANGVYFYALSIDGKVKHGKLVKQ